jgi:uncharacterized delta-60 repeat protein
VRGVRSTLGALSVAYIALAAVAFPASAAPGDLDPTFSTDGKKTTDVAGGDDSAAGVAIDDDGNIVVAGVTQSNGGDKDFVVARYLPGGALDSTFGGDGIVTTDLGGNDAARGLAIQPNGDILVAGTSSQTVTGWDFALVRYMPDGTPDDTFGDHGVVLTDFDSHGDGAAALALVPGGDIVLAGESNGDFALARYHASGAPDSGFDGDGRVTTDFATRGDAAFAIALDGSRIVAGGYSISSDDYSPRDVALARYEANGSLDNSFGGDGRVTTDVGTFDNTATGIAVEPGDRIVVTSAGDIYNDYHQYLLRYMPDGSPDTGFGDGGSRTLGFIPQGVALDSQGAILVAGGTAVLCCGGGDFAVARYTSAGEIDGEFGDPRVLTDFALSASDRGRALALQSDGRMVVAGLSGNDLAVARYLVDPGPADRDADGVLDARDKCKLYFGPKPDGCTFYSRDVSLRYTHGAFDGKITSAVSVCQGGRVAIFKKRRGADRRIGGQGVRGSSGKFSISAPANPGTYYARVRRSVERHVALCRGTRSAPYQVGGKR